MLCKNVTSKRLAVAGTQILKVLGPRDVPTFHQVVPYNRLVAPGETIELSAEDLARSEGRFVACEEQGPMRFAPGVVPAEEGA